MCGCFILVAGVLLCMRDLVWKDSYYLSCIARYLAGSSFGFLITATSAQLGDNVWKMVRGFVASTIAKDIVGALLLAIAFSEQTWNSTLSYHSIPNYIVIGVSVYVIIMTHWRGESEPITLLLLENEPDKAESKFRKLFDDDTDEQIIREEIEDKIKMVSEDYRNVDDRTFHAFYDGNWEPIFLMILLRLLNILTMNMYFLDFSGKQAIGLFGEMISLYFNQFFLISFRLMESIVMKCYLDKGGRRYALLFSGIISGLLFSILICGSGMVSNFKSDIMAGVAVCLIHAIAIGIDCTQHVYAAEAFPLTKRNASMAIVTSFEYISHGIIVVLWLSNCENVLNYMLIASPVTIIFSTIILFLNLPETKWKSLRQCRAEFNKYHQSVQS